MNEPASGAGAAATGSSESDNSSSSSTDNSGVGSKKINVAFHVKKGGQVHGGEGGVQQSQKIFFALQFTKDMDQAFKSQQTK